MKELLVYTIKGEPLKMMNYCPGGFFALVLAVDVVVYPF